MSKQTNTRAKVSTNRNRGVAKSTSTRTVQGRDAFGRFTSKKVTVSTVRNARPKPGATTKSRVTSPKAKVVTSTSRSTSRAKVGSSFVKSMVINSDQTVSVVMRRNPKTTYNYRPISKGLMAIRSALATGSSLGSVYNQYCRGREISRLICR